MNQSNFGQFKITMPIVKVFKKDGKMFVQGVSSSTDVDLTNERMGKEAIKTMASSIQGKEIPLRSEHENKWDSVLGKVTDLTVDKDFQLLTTAELKDTNKAEDLYKELNSGTKLGFSIGGRVNDFEYEDSIKTYKDISLEEISITSNPANPKTWVTAISKSVNKKDFNEDKELKKEITLLEKELSDKRSELEGNLLNKENTMEEEKVTTPVEGDDTSKEEETPKTEENTSLETDKTEEAQKEAEEATPEEAPEEEEVKPETEEMVEDKETSKTEDEEVKEEESKEEATEEEAESEEESKEASALVEALELIKALNEKVNVLEKTMVEDKKSSVGRKGVTLDKFADEKSEKDATKTVASLKKAIDKNSRLSADQKFLEKQAIDREYGLIK